MPIFDRPWWSDPRDSTAPRPQGRDGYEPGLPASAPPAGAPQLSGRAIGPRQTRLQPLDLELAATPASVATARHAVAGYCADQALDHDGVALAVSEAVTNAVMHAYRDREPGAVRVFASVVEGALVVVISDDGLGMTPRTDSPGMGLGLSLIAQFATTVEIDGGEDGTRVALSFEHAA